MFSKSQHFILSLFVILFIIVFLLFFLTPNFVAALENALWSKLEKKTLDTRVILKNFPEIDCDILKNGSLHEPCFRSSLFVHPLPMAEHSWTWTCCQHGYVNSYETYDQDRCYSYNIVLINTFFIGLSYPL